MAQRFAARDYNASVEGKKALFEARLATSGSRLSRFFNAVGTDDNALDALLRLVQLE